MISTNVTYNSVSKDIVQICFQFHGEMELQIGDAIDLGSKIGMIKYIGKTDFSPKHSVLGIELYKWSPNANDGIVNGKEYFNHLQEVDNLLL